MAKVISLRSVRKQKARQEARNTATASAAKAGRTGHEVTLQTRLAKALDQHLDRLRQSKD